MELFRWRVRNWLLVMVAVLVVTRGMGKAGDQVEGSSADDGDGGGGDSSPAVQPAPARAHGRPRQHQRQPKPPHEHARDHRHDHDHRPAPRGRLASLHHKPHAKHQLDAGAGPTPLAHPNARGRSRSDDVETHDLLDCRPQPGDKLLARSDVKADFRPLGFAETSWFFPQNGRDQRTIHCVRALDQRHDGHGGYPRIVRGGVGHHYVELNFKSDFSRGFHFVVEVYGQ